MTKKPPCGEILDLLKQGQVIPFLGAGVNYGTRPTDAVWDEKNTTFLPSGAELSRLLANKSGFPSQDEHDITDLSKVSSYFVETTARRRLRERLHDIFNHDFVPCEIHSFLAGIARSIPLLIVTTNYDDLTERAFLDMGCPFDLVVHPTDRKDFEASVLWRKSGATDFNPVPPNELIVDLSKTTAIYKMHGTVDRQAPRWDSYVITEEDYVDFLSRMTGQAAVPSQFMRYFRTRHFLFLGYGLRDWNLRVVLKNIRSAQPAKADSALEDTADELRSWAIQYAPSELEVELWNTRDVKVYDMDINEFVRQMREQG